MTIEELAEMFMQMGWENIPIYRDIEGYVIHLSDFDIRYDEEKGIVIIDA